ncbi:hypothetical protein O7602_27775 [Micromonospora sp. WMMD1128]|uniref:hypothetical protein n=1 Tax=unclassified Micromonospora TaxID=2617518 RepID=UPI00248B1F53|nr:MULTISPECIES: hypothetical protein [unclassified Micromonospora]WBB73431.1 hypothetical protein O7602_27775 [Micromonospora sp. WMMD1128]WFE33177.1 hypothetical protein O7613_27195 [Micromonospora sp. WMMD975]
MLITRTFVPTAVRSVLAVAALAVTLGVATVSADVPMSGVPTAGGDCPMDTHWSPELGVCVNDTHW